MSLSPHPTARRVLVGVACGQDGSGATIVACDGDGVCLAGPAAWSERPYAAILDAAGAGYYAIDQAGARHLRARDGACTAELRIDPAGGDLTRLGFHLVSQGGRVLAEAGDDGDGALRLVALDPGTLAAGARLRVPSYPWIVVSDRWLVSVSHPDRRFAITDLAPRG